MDIQWQTTIDIAAPFEQVFRYLSDFERHSEWSQTIDTVELVREGNEAGVGAQYRLVERQAMQVDRKPSEALREGRVIKSILSVRELTPFYQIRYRVQPTPKTGAYADHLFSLAANGADGTRLTMRVRVYTPKTLDLLARLRNTTNQAVLRGQFAAQWEAGLRNLREVMEQPEQRARSVSRSTSDNELDALVLQSRARGS